MNLQAFNKQNGQDAKAALFTCCGSATWVEALMKAFPFSSEKELVQKATGIWYNECNKQDWLDAFTHHPKIGDVKSLQEKFATISHLASNEQAGVSSASEIVIEELANANAEYEKKHGFIFIVCATGKTAAEMLRLLQDRLKNSYEEELRIAMGEQHKITILRLKKLLSEGEWDGMKVSQLTTHVLDTSIGKPAANITIKLQENSAAKWITIAQGVTNSDGRIADLLPLERTLPSLNYKMIFHTGDYFQSNHVNPFYPEVEIQFSITDDQHYHVPLLLNPFGYSTYRGS